MSNSPLDLKKVVGGEAAPPPCDHKINLTVSYAEKGVAKGYCHLDQSFVNGLGVIMGGFVASAADVIMAYAIYSLLDEKQSFATIDLHTTFHRPAYPGVLDVEAKVEKMGQRVAYLIARVSQGEKMVATVVSNVLIQS